MACPTFLQFTIGYIAIGLTCMFTDLMVQRYYFTDWEPDGGEVFMAFFCNFFVWWAFLPLTAFRFFAKWNLNRHRREQNQQRLDSLIADRLYARYRQEAKALEVEAMGRDHDWFSHWELVLRLTRAERPE